MLEKEKEWYDVEIDDDFFDDDVKDLKGFGNMLNKQKTKTKTTKDNSFDLDGNDEIDNPFKKIIKESAIEEKETILDDETEQEEIKKDCFSEIIDTSKKTIKSAMKSIEDAEVQSIIEATDEDVEKLEVDDDEKAPKLSFEEYVIENDINLENLKANVSAALYIAGDDGADINTLKKVTDQPSWFVKKLITIMIGEYWKNESLGIAIELYQKVFKFVTKPKCFESLGKVINTKFKNPLSQSVMETLAIIAYNQPCRKSVIEKIRAKDPKAAIDRLISLELIAAKQSDLPGRPFVYTVTNKFYDLFDLKSLSQLPKIETRLLSDLPTNDIVENEE